MRISDWSSDVCSSDLKGKNGASTSSARTDLGKGAILNDRLVFFGELLIRLTAPGNELLMQSPSLSLHVGGAEANVAIGLAHLGHDCAMVSTVPSNALGRGAVAAVREIGRAHV